MKYEKLLANLIEDGLNVVVNGQQITKIEIDLENNTVNVCALLEVKPETPFINNPDSIFIDGFEIPHLPDEDLESLV